MIERLEYNDNRLNKALKLYKNLIFLDFDGVCNSYECGSYLNYKNTKYGYDKDIIRRIRNICYEGDANIILASNWRRFPIDGTYTFTYENEKVSCKNPICELFSVIGDAIVGILPPERHINKSEALELWFEDHPSFDGKYAILDDDPREGYQHNPNFRKNLWLTDPHYGVTDKNADEIILHLKS